MKFGALPEHLLAHVNLRLPPQPDSNKTILSGKRAAHPKVYVGAAQWGHHSWTGSIYPLKTPAAKFRQIYPQHFNAIELNATHYNIYSQDIMKQWALPAKGKDFKFCPKFPQGISHHSNFQNTETLTTAFLESVTAFGEMLGPIFLQVSENYAPAGKEALYRYLSSLPKTYTYFLEVRHPAWFNNKTEEELFAVLQRLSMGAVITDAPGRRDVVHMQLSIPKLMLRFVCNGVHPTSFSRTDEWMNQLQKWMDSGLEEAYIFLHPGNDAAIPELATYWVQQLNEKCRLQLKPPSKIQATLF